MPNAVSATSPTWSALGQGNLPTTPRPARRPAGKQRACPCATNPPVAQCDGPTQTCGKNLEWFLHAPWFSFTALLRSTAALHTDHVWATIPGGLAKTLGRRLATPRGLDDAALASIDGAEGQACLATAPAPPARWEDWTREVEAVLLRAVGFDPTRALPGARSPRAPGRVRAQGPARRQGW